MLSDLTFHRKPRSQRTRATFTAATFVSALMVLGVSHSASAVTTIDVGYNLISFNNPETDLSNADTDDIGYDAQLGDIVSYEDVFPGVDAQVTVVALTNLEDEIDKIDEGQDPVEVDYDDTPIWIEIDPPGNEEDPAEGGPGSATFRVDFFVSGGTFTTPVTLTEVGLTVKDIDAKQAVTFTDVSSYALSSDPETVLVVTEVGDNITFAETEGEGSNETEQQHWAAVRYLSTDSVTITVEAFYGDDAVFGLHFTLPEWSSAPNEVFLEVPEVPEQPAQPELARTGSAENASSWGALGLGLAIFGTTTVLLSRRRSRV